MLILLSKKTQKRAAAPSPDQCPRRTFKVKHLFKSILSAAFLTLFLSALFPAVSPAAKEEVIVGTVLKSGKGFVIEADDGDYSVKGKDLSKFVGKLVEVTGIITESDKGDTIEVKAVEEVQE
jgi:Protein of unknown function (DUF5818)